MELHEKEILSLLPPRPEESNKGRYGKLLLIAGSCRFRGAAQLCAMGGLRMGFLGIRASCYGLLGFRSP